jgi:ribosome-associated translation inhibitor RaiA
MMRSDIIEIKAKQKLERIIIAEVTPEDINAAFDKLIQELTTIADLSTFRRKPGIGKGCPW